MHEHQIALARELERPLERRVVVIAVQHHLAAQIDDRLHLDLRGGLRHDDRGRDAAPPRRQRHALRMIARRSAHHAALRRSRPTDARCWL